MDDVLGWRESKIIDNQMYVLTEMYDGSLKVYKSKHPQPEQMFKFGKFEVPYDQEELVIKNGTEVALEEFERVS